MWAAPAPGRGQSRCQAGLHALDHTDTDAHLAGTAATRSMARRAGVVASSPFRLALHTPSGRCDDRQSVWNISNRDNLELGISRSITFQLEE